MSEVQRRIAALSPGDRASLERRLLERRRATTDTTISPRRPVDVAVLSSAQRRLWFFERLTPGAPTYNAVVAMWLCGPVDLDALERAFVASVDRHEVLRSVIEVGESDDEPVQRPLDDWRLRLGRHDASGSTIDDRRRDAVRLARELARAPYDLAHDLTLRLDVVAVAEQEYLLVVGEHHIAFDGWSDEILFGEVGAHYSAAVAGGPAPQRTRPPVQYADYAVWQRARVVRGELAAHHAYWRRTLVGVPAVSRLPLDRARPLPQRFEGRHLPVHLPHAEAVRRLRVREGVTDFMVLVAAWAATLYRWSGETDLVLGTPMANRTRPEVEELVGFFSNTVPLRIRIDGAQGFGELVRQVRDVALGAFEHQDLPFELIVEAAAPARVPGANPLFCVNVRVQSGPLPVLRLPDVESRLEHVDLGFARFDLAIEMQMQDDAIGGYLEYNEAVLDATTAEQLVHRLELLLGAALAEPDTALWSLPQPESRIARRPRSTTTGLASRGTLTARLPPTRTDRARCPEPGPEPGPGPGPVVGEVQVSWLDLDRPVPSGALATLSPVEHERAAAFRSTRHRTWFLRRRVHLRRILAAATGCAPAELVLVVDEHGRPTLDPACGSVRFSASSSGGIGLVCTSRHELGADVEGSPASPDDREVVRRLFADEEASVLLDAHGADFARLFLNCWSRKEAYAKAIGLGLALPLDSFAVAVHDDPAPALLRSTRRPGDPATWRIRSLDVPATAWARAAVVVDHHDPTLTIRSTD